MGFSLDQIDQVLNGLTLEQLRGMLKMGGVMVSTPGMSLVGQHMISSVVKKYAGWSKFIH